MSSKRVVFVVLAGLIGGLALGAVGLIVGATYGGNYATEFAFNYATEFGPRRTCAAPSRNHQPSLALSASRSRWP
jgi:hypothetical protein